MVKKATYFITNIYKNSRLLIYWVEKIYLFFAIKIAIYHDKFSIYTEFIV